MASLKEIIKDNHYEITDGIAWVVVYKKGRSWKCAYFYPEDGCYDEGYIFSDEDIQELKQIAKSDNKAICINGYYMGFGYDFTLKEIEDRVLWMYEARYNQLSNDFLESFVIQ